MPRRRLNLAQIVASTSHACPLCHATVTAAETARLDAHKLRCPHCKALYELPSGNWSQLHHSPE